VDRTESLAIPSWTPIRCRC